MKRLSLWTIALLLLSALCLGQAHAQTPTSAYAQYYQADRGGLGDKPRFGFLLSPYGPGIRPLRLAPSRFSLMTGSASANIVPTSNRFGLSTTVAGPNLSVLGSGTVGRLTKWTGITSSNSFIGNSTIFEDKNGLVGIGTDTPTSRLTVAGVIESSIGGFKFPDGTIQTTSAGGALFGVVHDATLVGNGTAGTPLGVAVPLILSGSVDFPNGVIRVINTAIGGIGVRVDGGEAGDGVRADGGDSLNFIGGDGVTATGGGSNGNLGGRGVVARGGDSFSSNGGEGVVAEAGNGGGVGNSGGIGIQASGGVGLGGATNGLAGLFIGDVEIIGNLSAATKMFKIDHPLDPENKYLNHVSIESPDMKNIYDGNVVTDENGEATVDLPAYFEALNRDFRYQLTVIGTFAQAIVADEINGNRFLIRTSAPNVRVSWQVTGIRKDPWANKYRVSVDVEKSELERGYYLHPEAFNQPEERGVQWARNPEHMQQMKESREKVRQIILKRKDRQE
jgi:hypothetical protein